MSNLFDHVTVTGEDGDYVTVTFKLRNFEDKLGAPTEHNESPEDCLWGRDIQEYVSKGFKWGYLAGQEDLKHAAMENLIPLSKGM